uniref:BESS domain-containing protein n=1 Tax=Ditylenchus dipsaci TaxID=166011 RepID=A0A915DIQ6_9BILA
MFGQQESNNIIEDQRISAIYEDQSVSYSSAQNSIINVRSVARVSCRRSMARNETQAHRCATLSASSCSIAFPSSRILPRWSCATKTFTLLIVLLTVMLPANLVRSATFFYGATDDSQNSPAPAAGASSELSKYSSGSKLSEDDLKSVYTFCSLLPMLESSGRIQKNDQSREICEKLIVMLQPMFAKRRSSTPVTTKQRRSIFSSEDVK